MLSCYRGSVNRWECDENDHLNVRFYVEKHGQALIGALGFLGVQIEPNTVLSRVELQHLRFLREARIAAPLSGYSALVGMSGAQIEILTELRSQDQVLSTCVHRLQLGIDDINARLKDWSLLALPLYAQSKGIADVNVPYVDLAHQELQHCGFECVGLGVVGNELCHARGALKIHHYMGVISDGMPHLWGKLLAGSFTQETPEGGAVLEFRIRYHQPLILGARYSIQSGLLHFGAKVYNFAHMIFDLDRGTLCVSAEAVAVRMDLTTRKAVETSAARHASVSDRQLLPRV
ncbi:MAG: hypothetical protein HN856_13530 [Gammaproteobacteria bacterium]|jgi:acyl-CoA thioester hydrolase|nr:hypothetical protein [Gammaproteobacteria bacterium]